MAYRWCLSSDLTHQTNQSSNIIITMTASTRVYYAFQRRNDLHPLVARIIHRVGYRRRFLYDIIIRRLPGIDDYISVSGLLPEHGEELAAYRSRFSRRTVLVKVAFQVMTQLVREFGFQGMLYSMRAWRAYVKYRVLQTSDAPQLIGGSGIVANRA